MARHIRVRLDHINATELEGLFGAGLGRTVIHATDVDTIATSLQLLPRDLRFLELQVDGSRTVHDAVLGSALGRLASLRLVALGLSLGFVRYADQRGQTEHRSTRQVNRVSPALKNLQKQLEEKRLLVQSQNHFERLGLHWSAHHRSYRAALDQTLQELDPAAPPLAAASDETKAVARRIRADLEASFKVLNDPEQRSKYRKKLFDPTEREYAADMLIKQGEVALMRGDRMQAIECLETAVELNATPRNRALLMSAREGRK